MFRNRWLFSTNAKDIAILYFIFAIFSGIVGSVMSLILRAELAAPGNQVLSGDNQLYNGTPSNFYVSFRSKMRDFMRHIKVLKRYVKHIAKPKGANPAVKRVCYKRGVIGALQVKFHKVKLMNPLQVCSCKRISMFQRGILSRVLIRYVELLVLRIKRETALEKSKHMGDLTGKERGNKKNLGLPEKGNLWGNGGLVVLKNNRNICMLRSVKAKELGKGTRENEIKEINTAGLTKLRKSQKPNLKMKEIIKIIKDKEEMRRSLRKIKKRIKPKMKERIIEELSREIGTGKIKISPTIRKTNPKASVEESKESIEKMKERIVQETMRRVLKKIYEESKTKEKSILREIRKWEDINWWIKIDIRKDYETIPHKIIINQLEQRIEDKKIRELVYKELRAGYYEKGTLYKPKIGIPRDSRLKEIWKKIVWEKIDNELEKLKREMKGKKEERETRIEWRRKGGEIIMGVKGKKSDCVRIKEKWGEYLGGLGWKRKNEEIEIKHASTEKVRFIEYEISKRPTEENQRKVKGNRIILNVPIEEIVRKLSVKGYCKQGAKGVPTRVGRLIHEEQKTIIKDYLALGCKLLKYYRIANNYKRFKRRLWYILYYSCVLTICSKRRLKTKSKTIKKYGFNLTVYKKVRGKKVIDTRFTRKVFDGI